MDTRLINGTASGSASSIQSPSPAVTGTFKLTFNNTQIPIYSGGWVYDIPSNAADWLLAQGLAYALNNQNIKVVRYGNVGDGATWRVYFRTDDISLKYELPLFVVDGSNLQGGTNNNNAAIQAKIFRSYSHNQLFEPIPSEMLFQLEQSPQVTVQVGSVLSNCIPGKCSYQASA